MSTKVRGSTQLLEWNEILLRSQVVAGSNVTLSTDASSITINAGSGTGGGAAFTLNGTSDSVSLVAGANFTINSGASSLTLVGPTVPTATNFSLNASSSSVS